MLRLSDRSPRRLLLRDPLQALLRGAADEASSRGHAVVLPEHLLREMARQPESARGLRLLGVDLLRLVDELERYLGESVPVRRWWSLGSVRLDEGLERAIETAALSALSAEEETLRTGDVLAALYLLPRSTGVGLLVGQGVQRLDVLRYIEHGLRSADPVWRPEQGVEAPGPRAVRMHNDRYTPMGLVVDVLREVFGHGDEVAEQLMREIHRGGSVEVETYAPRLAMEKAAEAIGRAERAGYPLLCTLAEPGQEAGVVAPVERGRGD